MLQGVLKILLRSDGDSFLIFEFEGKVPEEPHEGRKSIDQLLRIVLILPLEEGGELND